WGPRSLVYSPQTPPRRTAEDGYERLMVNIGKAAGFFPGNLMELINRSVVGGTPEIGRIDLLPEYTLFDVRKKDARKVVDALRGADFFGRKVRAEFATDRDYARDAKDRVKKSEHKKGRSESGEKKSRKSDKSARTDYEMSLGGQAAAKKKEKKERKAKKAEAPKAKYNGNYDIFKKK
ncbi:MAG: DbpA RNA binding domain-containing protein, partial [Muribaculaceae bacterium]|nr:DbpA RNA binding domain-containing protein [Muribaculaceae bacterium]